MWGSAGMGSVRQALVYVAECIQCDVGLANLVQGSVEEWRGHTERERERGVRNRWEV